MEKEIAMHSSTLAWKIPWTEKPGRLQSRGRKKKRGLSLTSLVTAPKLIHRVSHSSFLGTKGEGGHRG